MEKLAEIWTFLTTPGTELPIGTTVVVIGIIFVFAFLIPSFVKWRQYRKENPLEDPRDKYRNQGKSSTSGKSSSQNNQKKRK